jgi:hypothetical protein
VTGEREKRRKEMKVKVNYCEKEKQMVRYFEGDASTVQYADLSGV